MTRRFFVALLAVVLMGAMSADDQTGYAVRKCASLQSPVLSVALDVDDVGMVLHCGSAEYVPKWERVR